MKFVAPRVRWAFVFLMGAGACGRIGFDAAAPADGTGGDGPGTTGPPPSCEVLAPTCGPAGSSPCCESPVVTGGMFFRGYDVGTDNMFNDMTNPATVSSFRLDKYEVTVARFREFVASGPGTQANPPSVGSGARTLNGLPDQGGWEASWNASLAADPGTLAFVIQCHPTFQTWTDVPAGNENRPINCVTWYEAMAFCAWDGGYLPTEAEWTYALSGGEQRAYPWSSPPSSLAIDSSQASYAIGGNCVGDGMPSCTLEDIATVGGKPAGDGASGHSDLGGNLWEWMLDEYAASFATPCVDCANLSGNTSRVILGGGFDGGAEGVRIGFRSYAGPLANRYFNVGVRCARRL